MKRLASMALPVLTFFAITAHAVEPFQPVIPLFGERFTPSYAGFDLDPLRVGVETVGVSEALVVQPRGGGFVRSEFRLRLRFKDASTNSQVANFFPLVRTENYPDPVTAVGVTYYCYDQEGFDGFSVDPQTEDFPCDYEFNLGIANDLQSRYLVAGLATYAGYIDGSGETDVSGAAVEVFDPATGSRIWRQQFPVLDGDFFLVDALSGVGDYLGNDGIDEIRIVWERELGNGENRWRYRYYQISNGDFIKQEAFSVSSP